MLDNDVCCIQAGCGLSRMSTGSSLRLMLLKRKYVSALKVVEPERYSVAYAKWVLRLVRRAPSSNQQEFRAEMMVHFSGLANMHKPGVWLLPKLMICLDCGTVVYTVPPAELAMLSDKSPIADVKTWTNSF